MFAEEIIRRGRIHDSSKFFDPEKEIFDEYTPKLKDLVYGSEEYKECLNYIDVLIDGKYVEELRDLNLKFMGSSNQVYRVKENGVWKKINVD